MRTFERYLKPVARSLGIIGTAALLLAVEAVVGFPGHRAEAVILNTTRREAAQQAAAAKTARKDSKVELSVSVPLSKINGIVNQMSFQIENSGSKFGFKYEATIMLDKPTIASSGNAEHPIVATAHFRFEGHINGRNVQGAGSGTLPLGVSISSDWCPVVEVGDVAIHWDSLNVPFVIRFAIDSGLIGHIIQSEVAKYTDCDVIKGRLAGAWQTVALPILSTKGLEKSKGTTFYLNIRPSNIAITGVKVANDQITAQVQLTAANYIDQQPIKKEKITLPANPTRPVADGDDGREMKLQLFGDLAVGPP
jgi:hypothetical protein